LPEWNRTGAIDWIKFANIMARLDNDSDKVTEAEKIIKEAME